MLILHLEMGSEMKNSIHYDSISHTGIVKNVTESSVKVSIAPSSPCAGCQAEASCTLSGKEEKIIDISGYYDVKQGDIVTILMERSMGFTALFLGYVIPLFAVLTTLVILSSLKLPELITGLTSLGVLLPYYVILFIFRKRVNKKFSFRLKVL
jgi:positive regulator of sigma E activity